MSNPIQDLKELAKFFRRHRIPFTVTHPATTPRDIDQRGANDLMGNGTLTELIRLTLAPKETFYLTDILVEWASTGGLGAGWVGFALREGPIGFALSSGTIIWAARTEGSQGTVAGSSIGANTVIHAFSKPRKVKGAKDVTVDLNNQYGTDVGGSSYIGGYVI